MGLIMGSVSDITIINTRTPTLPGTFQVKERSFRPFLISGILSVKHCEIPSKTD